MSLRILKSAATAALLTLASYGAANAADFGCAGKKFVFFPGGAEGDSFASIVYNGAKLAAQQTGCQVDYVFSDWNPQKMVQQFSEAIARKPSAMRGPAWPARSAPIKCCIAPTTAKRCSARVMRSSWRRRGVRWW